MDTRATPLEPRPRGRGVLIVRNPRSGREVVRTDPADLIAERLPDARVHELAEGEALADAVDRAIAGDDPPAVLAILGGDGTVSRMAHAARRHGRDLVVLPGAPSTTSPARSASTRSTRRSTPSRPGRA